ncbi:glmS [Lepeophtheirus salmonis]|uniref:glutamine--fructose-6-phosphate transaminase (isomerizing) n=1 Tax=Lepeophtheirus salmonis TaxID=72036 RepID=A0A7R8HC01_LEPSM|nr:glmS [Lepeophtheirus salmonis]CAF3004257.1 glmS [Lepeophtheirus salmonis]
MLNDAGLLYINSALSNTYFRVIIIVSIVSSKVHLIDSSPIAFITSLLTLITSIFTQSKPFLGFLIKGLRRQEYRGYDSAGDDGSIELIKKRGKVADLENEIASRASELGMGSILNVHVGIAHTRWATHGVPSCVNSHPHRSDDQNEFVVVHNGIITNYKDIKQFLMARGHVFESETDTEAIAKLVKHIYHQNPSDGFRQVVEKCAKQLEGAFALCFTSVHFPGEIVAARRGSPLLIGIKTSTILQSDSIPVQYSVEDEASRHNHSGSEVAKNLASPLSMRKPCHTRFRMDSASDTEEIAPADPHEAMEYFFASDASAIIEHTNRVIYLEDDDIAAVKDGILSIHRVNQMIKRKNTKGHYHIENGDSRNHERKFCFLHAKGNFF